MKVCNGENMRKQTKSKFVFSTLFNDFFVSLKTTYILAFFLYFLFLFIVIIYTKLISQIAYLFAPLFSFFDFSMGVIGGGFDAFLILIQLPMLYLFFVLLVCISKIMFAKKFKTKNLFLIGFKQFILFLLFLLIPVFIVSIFGYTETTIITILAVLFLLAGFFIFIMLRLTLENNLFDSFILSLKQIVSQKAGPIFIVVAAISFVVLGIASLLIYYSILPDLLNYFVMPCVLIFILTGADKSVN